MLKHAFFIIKTLPDEKDWTSPTILIFGDLGNGNSRTLALLQDVIRREDADFTIHVGDFAYNLEVLVSSEEYYYLLTFFNNFFYFTARERQCRRRLLSGD